MDKYYTQDDRFLLLGRILTKEVIH